MRVSGFTFVRNVVKYDYPVVESIRSILPVVDEFIVNVGRCDDGTLELIRSIGDPKIKIVESVWDETLRKGWTDLRPTDQHRVVTLYRGLGVLHSSRRGCARRRFADHPRGDAPPSR